MARKLNTMTTLAAFALTASLALAPAADAQARNRQSTVTGANGRTATSQRTVARENGVKTRTGSVQTGQGYGATRNSQSGYNQESGQRYRSGSTTMNSGQTVSHDTTASCANGACNRSQTVTGPNGQTATHDVTRTVDENGNYVKSGTTTGASGDVYNRDVTRDGEGTKTTTVTDPNGETSPRTRWIPVEPH